MFLNRVRFLKTNHIIRRQYSGNPPPQSPKTTRNNLIVAFLLCSFAGSVYTYTVYQTQQNLGLGEDFDEPAGKALTEEPPTPVPSRDRKL
eukprot:snap_masked-scaffold_20-processed-gene-4.24-mRNA-1 protein AED:1.00 eAED:1.00 QI:0/-1/0/0/-1/1/1/0/89